ncbi:MAG: hypothetical protein IPH89_00035 [Bacteroidetes bacterium]|nr:hypothetical protein [Bacteroidota bacterium]
MACIAIGFFIKTTIKAYSFFILLVLNGCCNMLWRYSSLRRRCQTIFPISGSWKRRAKGFEKSLSCMGRVTLFRFQEGVVAEKYLLTLQRLGFLMIVFFWTD